MNAPLVALTLVVFCTAACSTARTVPRGPDAQAAARRTPILLTNDDGIDAPGINALRRALEAHPDLYDVTVVAPASNRSGSGMAKGNDDVSLVQRGPRAFAVFGTPADCVIAALSGVLSRRPDLVVSGMNDGANLGRLALMSGTVGAAMTAASAGLPAIAVSVGAADDGPDRTLEAFPDAAALTEDVIRTVVTHPGSLPPGRVLNVNYPALPRDRVRGVRATRQAELFLKNRTYALVATPTLRPGRRRLLVVRTGAVDRRDLGAEDQDARAFADGWVTVTPMDGDWTAESEIQAVSDLIHALPSPEPRP